ncbi:hypothetical protein T01_14704 [Trichinella spiralis]|uniref:Uncharacterized protein n=1 Tax=Trichinella spiralis TaxID=6334 RepID=A0A0V1BYB2_TRISP|nr:hypothetical protein T01_14704 [Trichinella spiralis]
MGIDFLMNTSLIVLHVKHESPEEHLEFIFIIRSTNHVNKKCLSISLKMISQSLDIEASSETITKSMINCICIYQDIYLMSLHSRQAGGNI